MGFLFLGFPSAWDKVFALLTGLLIVVMAMRSKPVNVGSNQTLRTDPNIAVPFIEHKTITRNPPIVPPSSKSESPTASPVENFIKTDATIS